jgi:alginate O-acetyltransferase complex protein AlgI
MLFNSFEFLFYFLVVTLVYFCLSQKLRLWFLLAASYYFYMRWQWQYAFLILGQTLVNFHAGARIGRATSSPEKRLWLVAGLAVSLGALFVFKYANFAMGSASAGLRALGLPYLIPHLKVILPVGISFFTFQTLSYTIDVYRGKCPVEPEFHRFALYVAFFPQLVAGPIERATHLLGQFRRETRFDFGRLREGLPLILWGLFKKVVIADRVAIYVARVYASPERFNGPSLLLGTVFFAFQIYCDFSAYSDIAIGSARILGYDLMQNFRLPYLATSISGFWKRWHISLSSWFGDYVYIPLGGNRVSLCKWVRNVFVVFLLSGLWHGANWTFVVWGGLHGLYYLVERLGGRAWRAARLDRLVPRLVRQPLQVLLVFSAVCLAWVFFRAASLADALLILGRMFTHWEGGLYMGGSQLTTLLSLALIALLAVVQFLQAAGWVSLYFSRGRFPRPVRWAAYIGMILGIALLGKSSNEFIYFQF